MCKIVIDVGGGLVRQIYCSDGEAEVTVVDWDAEGSWGPEIVEVPLPDGRRPAHVCRWISEPLESLAGTDVEAAIEAADHLNPYSRRELTTLLVALRAWQSALGRGGKDLIRAFPHFDDQPPLDEAGIDALRQRLNEPRARGLASAPPSPSLSHPPQREVLMSEHLSAEIWIGGHVPRRTARRLCAAIRDQAVALEWGDAWFDPARPSDLLAACRDVQGARLLYLCDEEAPWGRLETLESFLVENQIPFRRRSEGKYEYDPELAEYRPGHELLMLDTNHRGEALVSLAVIRQIQDDLRATVAALRRSEPPAARQKLRQALKLLASRLPPDLPPLPAFELV